MNTPLRGFIILLTSILFLVDHSSAETNFVTVSLTRGVTVDLPKNWSAMSDNKRITLGAWTDSVLEARKLTDVAYRLPFAANYYNDSGDPVGTMFIRFYPEIQLSQSEVIAAKSDFIEDLDNGLRQNLTTGVEAGGGKLVAWLGTIKKSINGSVYFVSEYRYLSPSADGSLSTRIFRTRLVRYLNKEKSFTIMVSYREDESFYLKPICEKIIGSIRH